MSTAEFLCKCASFIIHNINKAKQIIFCLLCHSCFCFFPYIEVYYMKIGKKLLWEVFLILRTTASDRQICFIVSCIQFSSGSPFFLLRHIEQKIQVK